MIHAPRSIEVKAVWALRHLQPLCGATWIGLSDDIASDKEVERVTCNHCLERIARYVLDAINPLDAVQRQLHKTLEDQMLGSPRPSNTELLKALEDVATALPGVLNVHMTSRTSLAGLDIRLKIERTDDDIECGFRVKP